MKIVLTLLIAFMIVSMINCHKSESPSNPSNNNIDTTKTDTTKTIPLLPLKIGNEWIYKVQFTDTTWAPYFDTLYVTSDTMIWSQRFFLTNTSGEQYHITPWYFHAFPLINMKDGLYHYDIPLHLIIRYPTHAGDTIYLGSYRTHYINSINVTINVLAGSFINCLEYIENAYVGLYRDHWVDYYYFKPGIGLVKYERFNDRKVGDQYKFVRTIFYELLKFKLN